MASGRGTYPRCEVRGCKRKAIRDKRCSQHQVMRDRYGNVYDPAAR